MGAARSPASFRALWRDAYLHPAASTRTIRAMQWNARDALKVIAFILAETFVMAACLEYWWFGQLYVRSTAYIWLVFTIVAVVPTLGVTRKDVPAAWMHVAVLQVLPVIASGVLMVLFRGIEPDYLYIDRYLYRSPLLVSLVLGFMLSALVLKAIYRKAFLGPGKGIKSIKTAMLSIVFFVIDLALMLGFVLFLLNYEGIIVFLP